MSDIAKTISAYISDNFMMGSSEESISNNDSFLEAGILDSTGVIELVTFIEDEFSVEMSDDEIVPENLDSIKAIEEFVTKKLAQN